MSKEAMKLELNNLISEFSMENSSFAKRVDDIFKEALAEQPAQPQQEPQTSVQERTEFEQFWVDELGEADELTYGKLGYAIRRVDVAWEAWKAGKISANQQTIVGRKVWIDWKAQALELRELVRLNGIKIAELESEQPAQRKPLTNEQRCIIIKQECRYTSCAAAEDHHRLIQAIETIHGIRKKPNEQAN